MRAIENRHGQRLTHRVVAMDILDLDGRVIDQHADRQRQTAQRHDIDRLPGDMERGDRGHDRERNGGDDDQSAAP